MSEHFWADIAIGSLLLIVVVYQIVTLNGQEQRIRDLEHSIQDVATLTHMQAELLKTHQEAINKLTELERLQNQVNAKLDRQDDDNSKAIIKVAKFFADRFNELLEKKLERTY